MENLEFATIDFDRKERCGVAEVIYGAGKSAEQIVKIVKNLIDSGEKTILVTRMNEEKNKIVKDELALLGVGYDYDDISESCVV